MICIFERSTRFGGRIYSLRQQGPKADLVVDLGAYRYAPKPYDEGAWSYIYTPLLGGLIDTKLKLHSKPYEPGTAASTVRKIVDETGNNAGYSKFVEAMMHELQQYKNFHIAYSQELVSIAPPSASSDGTIGLTFGSGLQVAAGQVLLNLPQLPLLKVLDRSEALFGASGVPPSLQMPTPMDGVKLYVHYSNAWWHNLLNLTSGSFGVSMHNATYGRLSQLPQLSGRYHDGHTRCDGPAGAQCRGYLEATYTYATGARWFLNHEPRGEPPYTELKYSQPTGKFALDLVHTVLLEYHKDALTKASKRSGTNLTELVEKLRPESALLSYWGGQTPGYGGAIHMSRPGPLLAETELAPRAMAPFGEDMPIYVANEAFGALRASDGTLGSHHGWAECSLVMAENVLTSKFGLQPPSWMNRTIYEEYVTFKAAPEERARRGGWHQG